jgi:cation diffusion facilitator CzcD-associated flavoprotein CzcO
MYRFHPSVRWSGGYPNRQQIISQITELWKRYGLESKTKFNTRVEKVYQDGKGRWIINNTAEGRFEGIIAAVGTCGDPKMPHLPAQDEFQGEIYHSSNLTGKSAKGKTMIVVGGGASAVEALEFATHEEAEKVYILARSDKWIIPRNPLIDALLSFNIFGGETVFSWIPELLLRKFFYRDLEDLAPTDKGLFTGTPMVNSDVMDKIRSGKAEWLRGDTKGFSEDGIRFNIRAKGVPAGGPGRETLVKGDIVVMATGYERPSLNFLPEDNFKDPYTPPNWYLQTFPPNHPSICCNNWYISTSPSPHPRLTNLSNQHLHQRHRHSRKLAHRDLHTHPPHVPFRPPHASPSFLDAPLDRHDPFSQVFRSYRRF